MTEINFIAFGYRFVVYYYLNITTGTIVHNKKEEKTLLTLVRLKTYLIIYVNNLLYCTAGIFKPTKRVLGRLRMQSLNLIKNIVFSSFVYFLLTLVLFFFLCLFPPPLIFVVLAVFHKRGNIFW